MPILPNRDVVAPVMLVVLNDKQHALAVVIEQVALILLAARLLLRSIV